MIEMRAEFVKKLRSATGRFQRNRDGQFVGYVSIDGEHFDCWLVFDDIGPQAKGPFRKAYGKPLKEPDLLKLSFENPYTSTKEQSSE
jgi:hypothetical protein